mmetsp:Transcript_66527/g.59694  ORF Transcript_66527/g.59694 Transcript_66527/m.59694 type:complete len:230 (-) Transcript_66527:129-818(-)
MERPPVIKLLTLGDSGGGKSSLLLRYTDDEFSDEFVTTIGMDFKFKRVLVNDKPVKVQIWDTAGQERFRTITQNYYRGAHGIILVCSVDDPDSKQNVKRWLQDVRKIIKGENFNAILVMNKFDIATNKEETEKEAAEIANELGLDYVLTSAKENIGVNDAFTKLIESVYDRLYGNLLEQPQIIQASNQNTGWFRNLFGQNSNDNNQQNQNVNLNNAVNTNNNANNSGCC